MIRAPHGGYSKQTTSWLAWMPLGDTYPNQRAVHKVHQPPVNKSTVTLIVTRSPRLTSQTLRDYMNDGLVLACRPFILGPAYHMRPAAVQWTITARSLPHHPAFEEAALDRQCGTATCTSSDQQDG